MKNEQAITILPQNFDLCTDLPSAVRMFLMQMICENDLPFHPSSDPFYSAYNQATLEKFIAQLNAGQTVTKTIDNLESMNRDGD